MYLEILYFVFYFKLKSDEITTKSDENTETKSNEDQPKDEITEVVF